MATYDQNLNMWRATGTGGYWPSQAEAEADEATLKAGGTTASDFDFITGGGASSVAAAPEYVRTGDDPNPNNPGGISDNELRRRQAELSGTATRTANINAVRAPTSGSGGELSSTIFGRGGAYDRLSSGSRAAYDYMHELGDNDFLVGGTELFNELGERAGVSHAGDSIEVNPLAGGIKTSPGDLFMGSFQKATSPSTGLGTTAAYGGLPVSRVGSIREHNAAAAAEAAGDAGAPGGFGAGFGDLGASNPNSPVNTGDLQGAETAVHVTNAENAAENRTLWQENIDKLRALSGGDYEMSDEARGYQQEGLQMQRDLLKRTLGFDPNNYARQYADRALAQSIAQGRSAGGGAAAQQAGMFAAMEQAPQLYAQGQREAQQLEAAKIGQAESAIKAFGELGTMTRNSDEQRQQFESNLQVSIGQLFNDAVGGKMALNEQESQRMTEVWMDFAQLQSVYDKMDSDEQLAAIDTMMADKGLNQQWEMFKENLKAGGQISSKDLVGGFFQLGGGAIGAMGMVGAANAANKGKQ